MSRYRPLANSELNDPSYDIVGVGLGPANLALAAAIEEYAPLELKFASIFVEAKSEVSWHANLNVDGASLQTPFLKDLATQRNPCSSFTFLNYLKIKNRLESFINLQNFFPTRLEFEDYLRWCAQRLNHQIKYGHKVLGIYPEMMGMQVPYLRVEILDLATNKSTFIRAKNVVLGSGLSPCMPFPACEDSQNIFHASHFLEKIGLNFQQKDKPYKFLIVGRGQSAGEIFEYLLRSYPNASVTIVSRGFLFRGIDASYFVNELYNDPGALAFHSLCEPIKIEMIAELRNTNYSVVDSNLIKKIAGILYEEKVKNKTRAHLHSYTELASLEDRGNEIQAELCFRGLNKSEKQLFNGVILATGYQDKITKDLLAPVEEFLGTDKQGHWEVGPDYRIETSTDFCPGLYLQGYSEHQHGFTEGTMSNVAARAKRILDSILGMQASDHQFSKEGEQNVFTKLHA